MSVAPRLHPYGDLAVLAEVGDTAEAMSYAEAVRGSGIDDVAEVVPGARTVLVVASRTAAVEDLRARLAELRPGSSPESPRETVVVEIGVRYDGPDLEVVAELTGLEVAEVVHAHTGTPWRVAFGGFAPGFAYLADGDARLAVPRRAEPRPKVPSGSVGLAGEFSAVYPSASPGGWQLIGTTEQVMWDVDRDPPALLEPGAWVRFVDVGPS